MTDQPKKTANDILADAVEALLYNTNEDKIAQVAAGCEMALRNYRAAKKAADEAPFMGIVNGAIAQLEAGDTEAAKKFLLTLVNVVEFSPTLALDQVVARPAPTDVQPFQPTHRHADGGVYRMVSECSLKTDEGAWVEGVAYVGDDLGLRCTTLTRWLDRFTLIPVHADQLQGMS